MEKEKNKNKNKKDKIAIMFWYARKKLPPTRTILTCIFVFNKLFSCEDTCPFICMEFEAWGILTPMPPKVQPSNL